MQAAVDITNLTKTFPGRGARHALDVPAFRVWPGEIVGLIGASGSGKSTLLRHIAGLTLADRGSGPIRVHGQVVQQDGRTPSGVRRVRAGIGVVFQQFNLVGRLPVLTNVLLGALARLPLWRSLPGWFPRAETQRAHQALARIGIAGQAMQRANTLSGGQQQRAAIARTLVQGARLILADEPIASLDPESSRNVMETLAELNQADGITVVVSLHQVDVAMRFCRRIVALRQGRIVYDGPSTGLTAEVLAALYGAEPPTLARAVPADTELVPA